MNRKFRKTARFIYRQNFIFVILCSLPVLSLPAMVNLLITSAPPLSAPAAQFAFRAGFGVLCAPLLCGYFSMLVRLRKTGEKRPGLLLFYYAGARRFWKAVCIGFPIFILPSLIFYIAPRPFGVLIHLFYLPIALRLFLSPYLLAQDASIFIFSAWQGSKILTKRRLAYPVCMLISFWWTALPVIAAFLLCILLFPAQLELSRAILLSAGYLTEYLAGPYWMLSMAELSLFLCTPGSEAPARPKAQPAASAADRLYERMLLLHGVDLDGADEAENGEAEENPAEDR